MEFTGKIIFVGPEQGGTSQHTGKPWAKITFVVEQQNVQFPKKAVFEVFGKDKFSQMPIAAGNEVTVSFDVDANEHNGRWYNTLRAWRVQLASQPQPQPEPAEVLPPPVQPSAPFQGDIPF